MSTSTTTPTEEAISAGAVQALFYATDHDEYRHVRLTRPEYELLRATVTHLAASRVAVESGAGHLLSAELARAAPRQTTTAADRYRAAIERDLLHSAPAVWRGEETIAFDLLIPHRLNRLVAALGVVCHDAATDAQRQTAYTLSATLLDVPLANLKYVRHSEMN